MLTETSPELLDALSSTLALAFGREDVLTDSLHTGGGIMVAAVDLSIDGRFMGRQCWLTREDDWLLGFYDYYADEEDEGVCVSLMVPKNQQDDPFYVASRVAAILSRLGVTKLQGE